MDIAHAVIEQSSPSMSPGDTSTPVLTRLGGELSLELA